ncbi:MAG TPA: biotin/lipoyl-containing protein, partial [Tahibacter sp.]|nr:biotin/lipoyl-containing protein [Tahibacter sp.]
MAIEVKVPVLPESVSDATIASWHKKPGDAIKRDENLVDLETDKVVLEVPAPADGVLKEIRRNTGDTVNSQEVIAVIEEGASAAATPAKAEAPKAESPKAEAPKAAAPAPAAPAAKTEDLSPAGRRVATENAIDPANVAGTGRDSRVTKEDLVNFMRSGGQAAAAPAPSAPAAKPTPGSRPEERVAMT